MYCTKCGAKKTPVWNGTYDPHTGEKSTNEFCLNTNCEEGRHNRCGLSITGHKIGWWSGVCKRCGYEPLQY